MDKTASLNSDGAIAELKYAIARTLLFAVLKSGGDTLQMVLYSAVGDPGAQGAGMTGTHGIGVRTPSAAAVAAATVGFAGD